MKGVRLKEAAEFLNLVMGLGLSADQVAARGSVSLVETSMSEQALNRPAAFEPSWRHWRHS